VIAKTALVALAGLLLLSAQGAEAKCGAVNYEVSVTVLERGTERPMPGALMVFFKPGKETALPITTPSSGLAETDTQGNFRGVIRFNTYSGWWFGDRCRGSLESLEIVVIPRDRPGERVRFDRLQAKATDLESVFALQPLTVRVYP